MNSETEAGSFTESDGDGGELTLTSVPPFPSVAVGSLSTNEGVRVEDDSKDKQKSYARHPLLSTHLKARKEIGAVKAI